MTLTRNRVYERRGGRVVREGWEGERDGRGGQTGRQRDRQRELSVGVIRSDSLVTGHETFLTTNWTHTPAPAFLHRVLSRHRRSRPSIQNTQLTEFRTITPRKPAGRSAVGPVTRPFCLILDCLLPRGPLNYYGLSATQADDTGLLCPF